MGRSPTLQGQLLWRRELKPPAVSIAIAQRSRPAPLPQSAVEIAERPRLTGDAGELSAALVAPFCGTPIRQRGAQDARSASRHRPDGLSAGDPSPPWQPRWSPSADSCPQRPGHGVRSSQLGDPSPVHRPSRLSASRSACVAKPETACETVPRTNCFKSSSSSSFVICIYYRIGIDLCQRQLQKAQIVPRAESRSLDNGSIYRLAPTTSALDNQTRHQCARINFDRTSDLDDVVQRDVHLPTLDLPEVGPVQVAPISQRLLAQPQLEPAFANAAAELRRRGRERRFAGGPGHPPTP